MRCSGQNGKVERGRLVAQRVKEEHLGVYETRTSLQEGYHLLGILFSMESLGLQNEGSS